MDINLKNCPECGHAVSNAVAACTYCGTVLSNEAPIQPLANETSETRPLSAEAPLELTEDDTPVPNPAEATAAEFSGPKDLFPSEQTTVVDLSPEIAELVEEDSAFSGEGPPESDLPVADEAVATEPAVPPEPEVLDLTGSTHGTPALELNEYIELAASASQPEIAMIPEPGYTSGSGVAETNEEAILLTPESEIRPGGIDSPVEIEDMQKNAEGIEQRAAILAKAAAFKQKKLRKLKAEALLHKKAATIKTAALQKQMSAQARIETDTSEAAAAVGHHDRSSGSVSVQNGEINSKMLGLLKKYEGQAIGINYDNSAVIKKAELVEANDELFSVFVKDKALHYSYPLNTILTVIEGADGVESSDSEPREKFNAVIKVYPLVLF